MKRIQAGEVEQLGHLFERHHLALFRYLCQLTRNRALSEDLTQEVFLRVLRYASSYKPNSGFRAWIFAMAHNVFYDARHKMRGEIADDDMPELQSDDPLPDAGLARRQENRLLQEAMNGLSVEKRQVLELSRFQDMRYEEIAALLQCEVGTVKVRVFRALKELREKFFELRGRQVA